MIERTMTLTIKDNDASLNGRLVFYLGDCGVRVNFIIQDVKYAFNQSNVLGELGGDVKVQGYARKQGGTKVINLNTNNNLEADTDDNIVKFTLTSDLTDELDEAGFYDIQLILLSYEGEEVTGQLTLPPFQFEIKKSLGV